RSWWNAIPCAKRGRCGSATARPERCGLLPLLRDDHAAAVAEQALVDRQPDARTLHLARTRLAAQVPRDLAHLSDGLRGDRLAEARQPAARVHRDAAADLGL